MTKLENLLVILMEECDETSQRASKAARFTLEEVQPNIDQNPKQLNNAQRLIYEFNDISATIELLHEYGWIDYPHDEKAKAEKKLKIQKYLKFSQELGTVQ